MRIALVLVVLGLWAVPAQAEERVLADEWTAEFEGGVKVAWSHQRIVEAEREGGQRRFVLEHRGWTPVGEATVFEEERVQTDSTGRVLRYDARTEGPRGIYAITFENGSYRVAIRKLPPVEGRIAVPVYDKGIVLALIRRGLLPQGRKKMAVLDLPGQGTRTERFSMRPRDDGRWELSQGDQLIVRSSDGNLVETLDKDRPRWTRRRVTAAEARDPKLTDERWKGGEDADRAEGPTVRVTAPPVPWVLRHQQDGYGTYVGMQHPLQTIVIAMEFQVPMGVTEKERMGLAANIRTSLNKQPSLPMLGRAVATTWRERPAVRFDLSGKVNFEPVSGIAWLVRSRNGEAVVVMGFHPTDLGERCAALVEEGLTHVKLDATDARKVPWRRVKPAVGGVTFEVPGGWLRKGSADKWVSSARMSSISMNEGRLPPAIDIPTAQKLWVSKLHQRPNLKDVKTVVSEAIEVDGRAMHRTVVTARVVQRGQPVLPLTAVSLAYRRPDQTYRELIVMAFEKDWDPGLVERVIQSVRWEEEPLGGDR